MRKEWKGETTTFYRPDRCYSDILRVTAKDGIPTEVGWLESDQSCMQSKREEKNAEARRFAISLFHELYPDHEIQCTKIEGNDGKMSAPVEKRGSKSLRTSNF